MGPCKSPVNRQSSDHRIKVKHKVSIYQSQNLNSTKSKGTGTLWDTKELVRQHLYYQSIFWEYININLSKHFSVYFFIFFLYIEYKHFQYEDTQRTKANTSPQRHSDVIWMTFWQVSSLGGALFGHVTCHMTKLTLPYICCWQQDASNNMFLHQTVIIVTRGRPSARHAKIVFCSGWVFLSACLTWHQHDLQN